jgi:hypothetical protein
MGQKQSKSTFSQRTKSVIDMLTTSTMNCQSTTLLSQKFVISGNFNTVSNTKMVQAVKLSTDCFNKAEALADIQNKLITAIDQTTKQQDVALLGAANFSKTQSKVDISNEVKQKITSASLTNMINSAQLDQAFIISGDNNIVDKFSMEQTIDIVSKAAGQLLSTLSSIQDIETKAKMETTSTITNPITELIDSIFGGIQGFAFIWVILAIAIIAGFVYLVSNGLFLGSLFGGSSTTNVTMQPGAYQGE